MRWRPLCLPLCLLLMLAACGTLHKGADVLPAPFAASLMKAGIAPESVALEVRTVDGQLRLSRHADQPFKPASVMKLVTTYAALDSLGPAYTWTTRAWADGPVARGVLNGNLVLQGGGDPLMNIERWWRLVSDLRQTGLKRIDGDIVIDNSYFADRKSTRLNSSH